ncbi:MULTISPECIES: hypothetical protein [Streptomyces]|uniref:DUF2933 domain-containing protein n=2 Tax=Streptomyces TaxID=1883 RepID=A0ABP6QNF9_9ACTN|nr:MULTISPECIES: hypothetical protein [Streptomyces]RIH60471.1 hypothetical protein D3C59_17025 [Streptomyces sp. SHP22-7]MBJ6622300.1 hypothetical protein [Streptomyces sp. DHE17-7]RSS66344.1 hypothetical protein EF907_16510 [Streptomyces sp. WAC06273]GGZ73110.1 hypothetical protein GCM10010301_53290 [Streptomyces plicatus]GHC27918.1 hypothetical protein GCM10010308_51260 [Streptomyces vinaceusdrappus]
MPQSLYPLLLLACPIGMGLMMLLMMRGGSHASQRNDSLPSQAEVAELRKEVAELRAARTRAHQPSRN